MPNSKIPYITLTDTLNTNRLRFNALLDSVGDVSTLTTTANNVTSAVNEHDAELGTISAGAMGTTATTVSTAIAELDARLDSISNTQLTSPKMVISGAGQSQITGRLKTVGDLVVEDSAYITGDLNVGGIFTSATGFSNTNLTLNAAFTAGNPTNTGGITMERGGLINANLHWNETNDAWEANVDSSATTHKILTTWHMDKTDGTGVNSGLSYNTTTFVTSIDSSQFHQFTNHSSQHNVIADSAHGDIVIRSKQGVLYLNSHHKDSAYHHVVIGRHHNTPGTEFLSKQTNFAKGYTKLDLWAPRPQANLVTSQRIAHIHMLTNTDNPKAFAGIEGSISEDDSYGGRLGLCSYSAVSYTHLRAHET